MPLKYQELTDKIIAAVYKVHGQLGYGYLEKVYENALMVEFRRQGIEAKQQWPISVRYQDEVIGEYYADILVEDKVLVELKVANELTRAHERQLHNYLTATGIIVGLVIGFGEQKATIRRKDV